MAAAKAEEAAEQQETAAPERNRDATSAAERASERERWRERGREREKETDRQTDRETERVGKKREVLLLGKQ